MSAIINEKLCPFFYLPLKTIVKIFATIVLFNLVLFVPLIFYLNDDGFSLVMMKYRGNFNLTKEQKEMKNILYWTGMFDSKTFWLGDGDIFKNCHVSECRVTTDRNLMKVDEFDAILFHGIETRIDDLPSHRSTKQKYVFVLMESPAMYSLDSAYLPDQFYNWTMTYRRDSDIQRPYGLIIDSQTNDVAYPIWAKKSRTIPKNLNYENLRYQENKIRFKGKSKTAAWFASHCNTPSHRERYVDELQNYMNIDIYGDCGPLYCKTRSSKCYEMLQSTYYFYISFENSLCHDYVTEKLYKLLSYDVVPVVYGAVNYSHFAPPDSYINIADFQSPKHLAEYLDHLTLNPHEYAKFFLWKKRFVVDLSHRQTICQMCEMLHNQTNLAHSYVLDMKKWWTNGMCQNYSEQLKKLVTRYYG